MLFGAEEMNAQSRIHGHHVPVREPRVNPGLAEFSPRENLEWIEPRCRADRKSSARLGFSKSINSVSSQMEGRKRRVEGFVLSVAQEVESFGIGITIIKPGRARTEFRYGGAGRKAHAHLRSNSRP